MLRISAKSSGNGYRLGNSRMCKVPVVSSSSTIHETRGFEFLDELFDLSWHSEELPCLCHTEMLPVS